MLTLRSYQRDAVDSLYAFFSKKEGNPLVVLPTGSGKSLVQASFIQESLERWPSTRILCLTHVRELLRQNADELRQIWPMAPLGINSAGLGRRDTDAHIIFAGIASVHNKAPELGRFDLVIIDECHLVPHESAGMYRGLLKDLRIINPALRVIGMTATPYRLGAGLLTEGEDRIFTDIAYTADLKQLITDGYLAPLISRAGAVRVDLSAVKVRGGEFVAGDLEAAFDQHAITDAALEEVCRLGHDRHAWLFFCSGVDHAQHVADALTKIGIPAGCVTGETPKAERDQIISRFKAGELRALTNANVLTTGFNVPAVDLLVFLRPTQSTSLYVQMAGRGMRRAEGKADCLVLDYSGNVVRHGPVDAVNPQKPSKKGEGNAPAKECPACGLIILAGLRTCSCGHEFPPPPPEQKLEAKASEAPILSEPPREERWEVQRMEWMVWNKKGADETAPKTLRVLYDCGLRRSVSEWICVEHTGFARRKAEAWWAARMGDRPCPTKAIDALDMLDAEPPTPPAIAVVRMGGGPYPELIRTEQGKPCAGCLHFDAQTTRCAKWGSDVPEKHRATGCQFHEAPLVATLVSPSDDVPF